MRLESVRRIDPLSKSTLSLALSLCLKRVGINSGRPRKPRRREELRRAHRRDEHQRLLGAGRRPVLIRQVGRLVGALAVRQLHLARVGKYNSSVLAPTRRPPPNLRSTRPSSAPSLRAPTQKSQPQALLPEELRGMLRPVSLQPSSKLNFPTL